MSTQDSQIVKKEEKKYLKYKKKYNNLKIFLQKGGFDRPWEGNSQLLYIALVISPDSSAGLEIEHRTHATTGLSAFSSHGNGPLRSPHLTLLQLYIPVSSQIDNLITNNLRMINMIIEFSFFNHINGLTIHSELDAYAKLGRYLTRLYDGQPFMTTILQRQTDFRIAIESLLLTQITPTQQQRAQNGLYNMQSGIPPTNLPSTKLFTHYSEVGQAWPNSIMALDQYSTTNWQPHISLTDIPVPKGTEPAEQDAARIAATPQLIFDFKRHISPRGPGQTIMSYINLWGYPRQLNQNIGSLSHIFVSYRGIHHWIPL